MFNTLATCACLITIEARDYWNPQALLARVRKLTHGDNGAHGFPQPLISAVTEGLHVIEMLRRCFRCCLVSLLFAEHGCFGRMVA